jgi:hypothetical protein
VEETAGLLCRDVVEVREKMKQLELVEHPGKRSKLRVARQNRYSHRVISRITAAAIAAPVKKWRVAPLDKQRPELVGHPDLTPP